MKTNNAGGPAFPAICESVNGVRLQPGMTLLDYFAARAPAEIPGWFAHTPATPRPPVPVPHETLTDEQYKEFDGYGDWLDEDDVCQAVKDFKRCYDEAIKALETWNREQTAARYFAWRWYYAEMMVSAREAL